MNVHRRFRTLVAAILAVAATAAVLGGCSEEDDSGGQPVVAIEEFAYQPDDLRVEVGTTVTFTNKDDFAHTVTSKDDAFDSGNLAAGAEFEHTFDEAGTFAYLCAIHNSMTGTVTVG